jgi:quaternary ammonium compound-resistance protein SugE
MAWVYLLAAGICEIVWAIGLKKSEGFTRPWTSAWTIGVMLLSFWLLSFAMKSLPLGTAYAVWTGIGAVGTVAFGMAFLNEPKDLGRIACIAMIIGGIIGLRFLGKV